MPKFKKGESGNPTGRPKLPPEIKEIARASSAPAFRKVVALMENADDERVQLAAAKEVLDRAWGKPAQSVDLGEKATEAMTAILEIAFGDGK